MVDFYEHVLKPAQEADDFVDETGGLPEITQATTDLQSAIAQTRHEIETAEFASRFPTEPGQNFRVMFEASHPTPMARMAVAEEGEAGLKRHQLRTELTRIENALAGLVDDFVRLRTDLRVSQDEFEVTQNEE